MPSPAEMRERYERITKNALNELWQAQPDNAIGGWCITLAGIPGTPADGNPPLADFIHEEVARHIAHLHNMEVYARRISG